MQKLGMQHITTVRRRPRITAFWFARLPFKMDGRSFTRNFFTTIRSQHPSSRILATNWNRNKHIQNQNIHAKACRIQKNPNRFSDLNPKNLDFWSPQAKINYTLLIKIIELQFTTIYFRNSIPYPAMQQAHSRFTSRAGKKHGKI